jgi:hypothetical protein
VCGAAASRLYCLAFSAVWAAVPAAAAAAGLECGRLNSLLYDALLNAASLGDEGLEVAVRARAARLAADALALESARDHLRNIALVRHEGRPSCAGAVGGGFG